MNKKKAQLTQLKVSEEFNSSEYRSFIPVLPLVMIFFFILVVTTCLPMSIKEARTEREINNETVNFLNNVKFSSKDFVVTDWNHMDWEILDYYYPEVLHAYCNYDELDSYQIPDEEKNKNVYFLIQSISLGEKGSVDFNQIHHIGTNKVSFVYNGALGDGKDMCIYKVINQ